MRQNLFGQKGVLWKNCGPYIAFHAFLENHDIEKVMGRPHNMLVRAFNETNVNVYHRSFGAEDCQLKHKSREFLLPD